MQHQVISSIKKHGKQAFACFLLFFSNAAFAQLPPGKIHDFSIAECQKDVCYNISGAIGYAAKFGDIFSSSQTKIRITSKVSAIETEYFCDDFKLEFSDKIATCTDNKLLKTTEFDFSKNKVTQLKL